MGTGVIPAPPKAPDGITAIGDVNGEPNADSPGSSSPDSQGFDTAPAPEPVVPGERAPVPPSRGGDRPAVPPPSDTATQPSTPEAPEPSASQPSQPEEDTSAKESDGKKPPQAQPPPKTEVPGQKGEKPATPTLADAEKIEADVVELVNKERAKAGCDPVKLNNGLAKLARSFSVDMALRGFFAHLDPDGNNPWDRAEAAGIGDLGAENIARGHVDAQAVMDDWMSKPAHRENILNCDFKTIGVGVQFGDGGPWWTQTFGL